MKKHVSTEQDIVTWQVSTTDETRRQISYVVVVVVVVKTNRL